jgi:hypothetical protein
MKQVLLFVAIITICGSLKMPEKRKPSPCPERGILREVFFRGKLKKTMHHSNGFIEKGAPSIDLFEGKEIIYDSISYTIK